VIVASISDTVTTAINNHGVWAVFFLMAVDAVFPAASELVMLYAGALAAGVFGSDGVQIFGVHFAPGASAYLVMALAGTLGYLAGAIIGWAIGLYGGRPLLERHGKWFHLSPEKLDRAEAWFERWGNLGVLVGRVTPVVRSFVSIPAGVFEMPFAPYVSLTAIGSAIWAFAFAGIGYAFGSNYNSFDHGFRFIEYAVVVCVLIGAAYLVYRWRARAKVHDRADDSAR